MTTGGTNIGKVQSENLESINHFNSVLSSKEPFKSQSESVLLLYLEQLNQLRVLNISFFEFAVLIYSLAFLSHCLT